VRLLGSGASRGDHPAVLSAKRTWWAPDEMSVRQHLNRLRVVRVVEDEIERLVAEVADTRSQGVEGA
jgi:hypothetical protein